ncbi:unnamed protein product [Spirodela intermedia]|uniref:Uncharacterized protein n=1 Tax=Spirodela intermedia TaxID=51605 RepID=A0A7I8IY76_SPIIN|nr:unnamed protein product [Spirodela intermedia]CAA6662945.1 unnamed protein product [Spirodela intermedia]
MDLWAAFAAAGAEYLAKHKQESSKSSGVGSSRKVISNSTGEESEVNKPSVQQVVIAESRRCQSEEAFPSVTDRIRLDSQRGGVFLERTAPSGRVEGDILSGLDEYMSNTSTLLSLQPWIFRKESYHDGGEVSSMTSEDQYPHAANMRQAQLNSRNVGPGFGFGRSKNSLRSRRARRFSVKPLTCIDNSLIPQIYSNNFDFEEFLATPIPSPASPPVRPFVVTDGRRIISKSSSEQVNVQTPTSLHHLCGEADNRERELLIGDQGLQPCRPKRKCEEADLGRLGLLIRSHAQEFPIYQPVGHALFFCLGVSVGVMSSFLSSSREVDKLNDLLKQRENLVQDLQEELVMKDSLSVSEIADETHKGQEHTNHSPDVEEKIYSSPKCGSTSSSPEPQQDNLGSPALSRGGESEESLSKIEAELEAELEKLELNINATSLEVEPDFVGDIVHGELRVNVVNGGSEGNQPAADSRPAEPPANYAVSPRQLSLRLHELIQSQLEDRIKELEEALSHSQRRGGGGRHRRRRHLTGAQRPGSLSDPGSPTMAIDQLPPEMSQPLCLNLSGDALDAYHEAYEEFQRSSEADEEETLPPTADNSSPAAGLLAEEKTLPPPMADDRSTATGLLSVEEETLPPPMADDRSTATGLLSAEEETLPPTAGNRSPATGLLVAEETLPLPMANDRSTATGCRQRRRPWCCRWPRTGQTSEAAEETLLLTANDRSPAAGLLGRRNPAAADSRRREHRHRAAVGEEFQWMLEAAEEETLPPMPDDRSPAGGRLSTSSKSSVQGSTWSPNLYGVVYDDDDDGGGGGGGDGEDEDEEDEEGRMLIQRILERARKGSPVVQNAQRMLSLGAAKCCWDEGF